MKFCKNKERVRVKSECYGAFVGGVQRSAGDGMGEYEIILDTIADCSPNVEIS